MLTLSLLLTLFLSHTESIRIRFDIRKIAVNVIDLRRKPLGPTFCATCNAVALPRQGTYVYYICMDPCYTSSPLFPPVHALLQQKHYTTLRRP